MTEPKLFPVAVILEINITDGEQIGSARYVHGHGKLPTEDEMPEILASVTSRLPPGFRLMNRAESSLHFMREHRGYRGPNLVIPKPDNGVWHDPDSDVDYADNGDDYYDEGEE